ncbi:hypothetical protein B0T10DRAFT_451506 [Thelonectria olida]|uniref:SnoaL-like domain-containing protein n=1 Tax=Thelonectria olida TaxID=1576542 RepID=A0A9P9AGJ6_9HYPO|nr:hypothetical protein B0T10DRAFT_451506 [Thelonectria olida]
MAASSTQDVVNWTSDQAKFAAGFESIFVGDSENTEDDLKRLFMPTYTQEVDGRVLSFPEFVDHIRHLRTATTSVKVKVSQFLRDGNQLAERHTVSVEFSNKPRSEFEVFLFGVVHEDGRLSSVVETIRHAEGDAEDKDLGHAMS